MNRWSEKRLKPSKQLKAGQTWKKNDLLKLLHAFFWLPVPVCNITKAETVLWYIFLWKKRQNTGNRKHKSKIKRPALCRPHTRQYQTCLIVKILRWAASNGSLLKTEEHQQPDVAYLQSPSLLQWIYAFSASISPIFSCARPYFILRLCLSFEVTFDQAGRLWKRHFRSSTTNGRCVVLCSEPTLYCRNCSLHLRSPMF